MNRVKFLAKSSERPDGWYAVVEKENGEVKEKVFEEKCIDEKRAINLATAMTVKYITSPKQHNPEYGGGR